MCVCVCVCVWLLERVESHHVPSFEAVPFDRACKHPCTARFTMWTGMHSKAICALGWSPRDPLELASTGFDSHLNVYDLRRPDTWRWTLNYARFACCFACFFFSRSALQFAV